MSLEQSLEQIIDGNDSQGGNHKVTRYRRRDLRNGLADRIGKRNPKNENILQKHFQGPPKKRVKISNIPLDVSDYVIEDMLKEFGSPVYFNIYDSKEDRSAIFEFPSLETMEAVVDKFDNTELNGSKITLELIEVQRRQDKRRKQRGGDQAAPNIRGRHGNLYKPKRYAEDEKRKPKSKPKPTTAEDLDAELDAYMKG